MTRGFFDLEDYELFTMKYKEIADACPFIFNTTEQVSIDALNQFKFKNNDSIGMFERKEVTASTYMKKWTDLSGDERKEFFDCLSKMNTYKERAFVDLMLYTMKAPGYEAVTQPPSVVYGDILGWDHLKRFNAGYPQDFKVALQAEIPGLANSNGWSYLMDAIQKGDNDRLKRMLEKATDDEKEKLLSQETTAKYVFEPNETAIQVTNPGFSWGHKKKVKIQKPGFKKDDNGSTLTPLIIAVRLGNLNAFDMLLKAGAKVDQKDSSGKTALDWAREIMKKEGDLNKKAVCEKMVRMLDPSQSSQPQKENDAVEPQTANDGQEFEIPTVSLHSSLNMNSENNITSDNVVLPLQSKDRGMV